MEYRPNQWGVTLKASDDEVRRFLTEDQAWSDLRDLRDPVEVGMTLFDDIQAETMADLDNDGDTIIMGLCRFTFPLTVSLSELVDDLIETCAGGYFDGRKIDDEDEAAVAVRWVEAFETAARKIRERLPEERSENE